MTFINHLIFLFFCHDAIGWFDIDDTHNTNVYVSGLHMDTTDEEFLELVSKCGIIMKDEQGKANKAYYVTQSFSLSHLFLHVCSYHCNYTANNAVNTIDEQVLKLHQSFAILSF